MEQEKTEKMTRSLLVLVPREDGTWLATLGCIAGGAAVEVGTTDDATVSAWNSLGMTAHNEGKEALNNWCHKGKQGVYDTKPSYHKLRGEYDEAPGSRSDERW